MIDINKSTTTEESISRLYDEAENKTNKDNIKCLAIFDIIILLCDILNEIGVFEVAPFVMRLGTACGIVFFSIPIIVLARPLCLIEGRHEEMIFQSWYKYFIIGFAWLGTVATCITLTHHTVIVMAVPIMIMGQYRNTRKLVALTFVFATICVMLGVYGGYFWGCFDANLLETAVTDENVADLAMRANMATIDRMIELFPHYALPRLLIVIALVLLASKISRRNDEMLKGQAELLYTVEKEMARTNEIQKQVIDAMANLIENRDESTGEHVKRTSFYVESIVNRFKAEGKHEDILTDTNAETIVRAAPLHDIGKIIVADRILLKPGKLTPEEFEEIKLHAAEGAKVIKNVLGNVEDDDFIEAASEIAGGHHERWDGKGYPKGLAGEEIPLAARIMAVADVFDALVSKRVYKPEIPVEEAFAIIESESGKQFDPEVVKAFCELKPEILEFLKNKEPNS